MPAISISEVPPTAPDTQTSLVTGKSRERDDTQKSVDAHMKARVAVWVKHRKPPADRMPAEATGRFAVAKTDVQELKSMIRRAATLHKVKPVFFADHVRDDGLVQVKYTVGELPPAPPKPPKTEAASAQNGTQSHP